jgi:hypothetical protein
MTNPLRMEWSDIKYAKKRLEDAYEKSVFSAGKMSFTYRPMTDVTEKQLGGCINMRLHSFISDSVLRGCPHICVPHVQCLFVSGGKYHPVTKKWDVLQKESASYSQTLRYVCKRCRMAKNGSKRAYQGALIPLSVGVKDSTTRHSNMLYVDLRPSKAICYLFEPNGTKFIKKTDSLEKLKKAIRVANKRSGKEIIISDVKLFDGVGVQQALGYEHVVEKHPRFTRHITAYHGIGICSAVTHWTMRKWFEDSSIPLSDFCENLSSIIKLDPAKYRKEIFDFIKHDMGTASNAAEFQSYMSSKLDDDFCKVKQRLPNLSIRCDFEVTLSHMSASGHINSEKMKC